MPIKQTDGCLEVLRILPACLARSKTRYISFVLLQQEAIASLASCVVFTRLAAGYGYEYDRLADGMLYSLLAGLQNHFRERMGSV